MKICRICSFKNTERVPTCLWCNAVLADVRSTEEGESNELDDEQRLLSDRRTVLIRRNTGWATFVYALGVVALSIMPGMIFDPVILAVIGVSALLIAWLVIRNILGRLLAAVLQVALSMAVLYFFNSFQLFVGFMATGHALICVMFCLWIELIYDMNR